MNNMNNVSNMKLEAPWYSFQKKVKALFGQDPDIIVGELEEMTGGDAQYGFSIEIRNHEKFLAFDSVFPKVKTFGNVAVCITLYDEENGVKQDNAVETYRTIFDGNPLVKDVRDAVDFTGTRHGFVRFQPQVIQFFADNTADFDGNWSGLAQDIAREIFADEFRGIHFCTAAVGETYGG